MTLDSELFAYVMLTIVAWGVFAAIEMGARRSGHRWAYVGLRLWKIKDQPQGDTIRERNLANIIEGDEELKEFGFEVKQYSSEEYLVFIPLFLGWFQGHPGESMTLSKVAWWHPVAGRMYVDKTTGVISLKANLSVSAISFSVLNVLSGTLLDYANGTFWLVTALSLWVTLIAIIVYSLLARLRMKVFLQLLLIALESDSVNTD